MSKLTMTLGAKAARDKKFNVTATVEVDLRMTRRFIWMMKLRHIWAIIRAKVAHE